ncbi:MAG: guanylate kinase [Deltaproteobacteria bacterium]|nr:guanylate kinase [Deltaproteobacteria bacterium]
MRGILFIISAPSGAGKTTLCNKAIDFFPGLRHSVSYTTRLPRQREIDGVEYHFITDAVFDEMVERGEFLEYASVHGKRYGTSRKDLEQILDDGFDVVLDIDVQGARQVKERLKDAVFVFILPPSLVECEKRLRGRNDSAPEDIELRLKRAEEEMQESRNYDYVFTNDNLDETFERLKAIMIAEREERRGA